MDISKKPTASYFYSIKPINIGTPMVECLNSYLKRLAEAHNVRLRTLVSHIISLHKEKCSLPSKGFPQTKFVNHGMAGNTYYSMAPNTSIIAESLEPLTLQKGFKYMTMLTWKGVIHSRGLYKSYKKWCPQCLDEWKKDDEEIYEPYIWYLDCATVCLKHKRKLEVLCPNPACKLEQVAIKHSRGYCYACDNWLGQKEYNSSEKQYEITQRDEWMNKSIGELLQVAPYIVPPTIEEISLMLEQCVTFFFQSDPHLFCKEVGIHHMTLNAIILRRQRISLPALLSLSAYTKTPLLKLLNLSYKSSNEQNTSCC
ncbi:TniQ family protein [Bacillus sp. BS98]|uniref:TniQ family protein n=1 Tax=Bacillus sp. BS98 TaxID=2608254 RepID=UPI00122EC88F|nr:TniQ family protein [Bacillus sp. BS98]EMA7399014.1 TniQ family protein [Bacillus cereus]QEQ19784.1 TniQ family protein [Bacillus sp. BS98]